MPFPQNGFSRQMTSVRFIRYEGAVLQNEAWYINIYMEKTLTSLGCTSWEDNISTPMICKGICVLIQLFVYFQVIGSENRNQVLHYEVIIIADRIDRSSGHCMCARKHPRGGWRRHRPYKWQLWWMDPRQTSRACWVLCTLVSAPEPCPLLVIISDAWHVFWLLQTLNFEWGSGL